MSAAVTTLIRMNSDDVVDPGDAAFQALLAFAAANLRDKKKRDLLVDGILTAPPMNDWPSESLDALIDTCRYIFDLGDDLRRRAE